MSQDLAQLSVSIETVTKQLEKEDAKVDEIVSYQADAVFTKTPKNTESEVQSVIGEKVVEKKIKSSLLRKLLAKKPAS